MLGELRHKWAPRACVISFKLETDKHILLQKVQVDLTACIVGRSACLDGTLMPVAFSPGAPDPLDTQEIFIGMACFLALEPRLAG